MDSKGAITTKINPVAQVDASFGESLDASPKAFVIDPRSHLDGLESRAMVKIKTGLKKQPDNQSTTNNALDNLGKESNKIPKKFSSLKRAVNMILGDSLTHLVNIAELERVTGKFLYFPGKKSSTGAARKYRCYTSLGGGKFPNNSYKIILPQLLRTVHIENLFLQIPTNDISSLSQYVDNRGTIELNRIDMVHTFIYNLTKTMINFANFSLENYPIKLAILIDIPMRIDKMSDLSKLANKYLRENLKKLNNKRIIIANHSIHKQGHNLPKIFGNHQMYNFDRIHLRGVMGRQVMQKSFTNIIRQALPPESINK